MGGGCFVGAARSLKGNDSMGKSDCGSKYLCELFFFFDRMALYGGLFFCGAGEGWFFVVGCCV